jgi:hypothetical protein
MGEEGDEKTESAKKRRSNDIDKLANLLVQIDNDEISQSFGGKDAYIAAYLEWLSQNPDAVDRLFNNVQSHYQGDLTLNPQQKSDIVRLLFRIGLQQALPDHLELLRSAASVRARRKI